VLSQNQQYVELLKGDTLYLSFQNQTAVPQGMKRSFVFETRGRYVVPNDSTGAQGGRGAGEAKQMTTESTVAAVPTDYALKPNFPNPFNPSTVIQYQLPKTSNVTITVHDILGRTVATLVNERKAAGYHQVNFKASNFASGTYFYRIQAGEFVQTKKMLLVK
jgi:hypothetical protein